MAYLEHIPLGVVERHVVAVAEDGKWRKRRECVRCIESNMCESVERSRTSRMMTARSDRTCPPPHSLPPSCCVFAKILPGRLSFRYEVCLCTSHLFSIASFSSSINCPLCLTSPTSSLFSVSTLTSPRRYIALFISSRFSVSCSLCRCQRKTGHHFPRHFPHPSRPCRF